MPSESSEAIKDSAAKRVLQTDIPRYTLKQALAIPQAIVDSYGKQPTKPLRVAEAAGISPTSSHFRMITGAAAAYGLTIGGYNAAAIELTESAKKILTPTNDGHVMEGQREAVLRPKICRDFLTRYNNSKLPKELIAMNVLEEMGVPRENVKSAYSVILDNATLAGFLRDLKGEKYVDLDSSAPNHDIAREATVPSTIPDLALVMTPEPPISSEQTRAITGPTNNKVFITHGHNKEIVAQIKEILKFGNFDPVVCEEQETVTKPVPYKVMDAMRECSAAIIHVGKEGRLLDSEGAEIVTLNQNVLIEIGAAMALYHGNFILLVEKGVTLPSNLQGLYEVRYEGEKLDYNATMKLLKAFNDFKENAQTVSQ